MSVSAEAASEPTSESRAPWWHRRHEDAKCPNTRVGHDGVSVMLVEQIHGSRRKTMCCAVIAIDQLSVALDDPHGLDVVGVMQRCLGARMNRRLME